MERKKRVMREREAEGWSGTQAWTFFLFWIFQISMQCRRESFPPSGACSVCPENNVFENWFYFTNSPKQMSYLSLYTHHSLFWYQPASFFSISFHIHFKGYLHSLKKDKHISVFTQSLVINYSWANLTKGITRIKRSAKATPIDSHLNYSAQRTEFYFIWSNCKEKWLF